MGDYRHYSAMPMALITQRRLSLLSSSSVQQTLESLGDEGGVITLIHGWGDE